MCLFVCLSSFKDPILQLGQIVAVPRLGSWQPFENWKKTLEMLTNDA